jgi:hypothetical protein
VSPTHWRIALGACLLVAGVMTTAGGAVAVAAPGVAHGIDGSTTSVQGSTRHGGVISRANESLPAAFHDATTPFGVGRQRLTHSLVGRTDSAAKSLVATVQRGLAAANRVTTPPRAATVPDAAALAMNAFSSATAQIAPAADAAATTVQHLVEPVTNDVASIPALTVPITDFVTASQDVLTSATAAVAPLTEIPSRLLSLFAFGLTGTQPGSAGVDTGGPSAASPLGVIRFLNGTPGVASTDTTTAFPTLPETVASTVGLSAALSRASAMGIPVAPHDAGSGGLQAFLHSCGGLVGIMVAATFLSALAVAAWPGVAGLLVSTAAGVRIGHRQARARMALRTSGIARFAVDGPVGIVRSASLVALRPNSFEVARRSTGSVAQRVA